MVAAHVLGLERIARARVRDAQAEAQRRRLLRTATARAPSGAEAGAARPGPVARRIRDALRHGTLRPVARPAGPEVACETCG